jgi:16S rRNA (cytidine1402-2'-O)-methyltransferase
MDVIPLIGPSSILLALIGSGLNGQNFAFNGYLPKEQQSRIQKIKELERRSIQENQTQIFMEAPYRNEHVFEDLLSVCHPETLLSLAINLASSDQMIKTLTLREWKGFNPDILKILIKDKRQG